MKKILLIAAVLLVLIGCRSTKPVILPPTILTNVDSTVVKEDKKEVPADSSWFYAYFKCDSNNKVIMASLNNGTTQGLQTNTSFKDGVLNIKTVKPKDSISVFSTFRFVYRDRPVYTPYPVEKELTKWQNFRMMLGNIFLGLIIAALGYSVFRLYKYIRK
ncbi:MAG: hypothetical protein NTZ33_11320 [Bacteroidetes bacterium]|nr:hypothetical protein [Bacteroidota bacterium]